METASRKASRTPKRAVFVDGAVREAASDAEIAGWITRHGSSRRKLSEATIRDGTGIVVATSACRTHTLDFPARGFARFLAGFRLKPMRRRI